MKRILAIAVMLVSLTGAASAQGGGGGMGGMGQMTAEQRVQMQMDRLFKDITLTADQKTKATAIIKNAQAAIAALDRQAEDFRAKMGEIRTRQNADLKALLTSDEDKAKFDANAAAGGRRGGSR